MLQERMDRIQQTGAALGMSIDDGDTHRIASLSRLMGTDFMATRGIKPQRVEPLTPLEVKRYDRMQEEAIQDLGLMVQAAESNNFTAIATVYNDVRSRCASCHRSFVDRPVMVALPVLKNF